MISRFEPDPSAAGYLYVHVADHIAERIEAGELKGQLPGERDLTEEYRVSLGTMRNAIKELRKRGLIETYHGKRSFIVPKS
ncbi:winged helix-turn-helix domain-containing protein [Amycolatopsis pithecellobii]|uniref:GntR family transcriptional regulator n=1 Tax=Amycolatopsis pithecellobii TaxID=664692 RepID=A0A6N7YXM1_9PSEU|nr:winged helix-turn-helix domain-containing protein [Amycolatopsis pithecellobii]MTD56638.1 GntR family transcriptional regulator [Amycolatopsis pithecellobii]